MRLEDQVVSLKLSIQLKNLKVKQKSIFVWEYVNEECYGVKFIPFSVPESNFHGLKNYSAFTIAELGEILPVYLTINKSVYRLMYEVFDAEYNMEGKLNTPRYYWIGYGGMRDEIPSLCSNQDEKEADARAMLLIHLLSQGYIKNADY